MANTLRILYVRSSIGGLGDTIRMEKMFRFLQKSGFKVYEAALPSLSLAMMSRKGVVEILGSILPLHKLRLGSLRDPILQYLNFNIGKNFLDRLSRKLSFDLILVETSLNGWLALDVHKKCSKPLIVDIHGLASAEARGSKDTSWGLKEKLEVEVFNECNHLLVVSNSMKEHIRQQFGIRGDKISVIYNGADPRELNARFSHPLKVIYAGNFAYWEHVDVYLDIAKRARPSDFKFILAGTGAMRKHILGRIKKENIPIRYLGQIPRSKVLDVISEMQVGIAPSTRDIARLVAFPIKVLDYMSCGLPVITPNIGDWGKMIKAENCGIALEDGSVQSYISALETMRSKDVWEEKSNAGIQAIRAKYSWDRVLTPLKELITQFKS